MKKIWLIILILFFTISPSYATTIEELRTIVAAIKPLIARVNASSSDLEVFITEIEEMISTQNVFNNSIDPNAFVAIQTPIYIQLLTDLETAADALNTDPLH